jgi:hypothetical protein
VSNILSDLPADVQTAFDAAVDAHRRFERSHLLGRTRERIDVRRAAVNDLAAANRALAAYHFDLPQLAARAAKSGGAR